MLLTESYQLSEGKLLREIYNTAIQDEIVTWKKIYPSNLVFGPYIFFFFSNLLRIPSEGSL